MVLNNLHVYPLLISSNTFAIFIKYVTIYIVHVHKFYRNSGKPWTIVLANSSKLARRGFLLHFLMHIHFLMLCRIFELITIKIRFFTIF